MQYKTYIFDLDGTLLNSLTDLANSCNYALKTHQLPTRTQEEVRMMVGNGVKKLMERAIESGTKHPEFQAIYSTFRQHYLNHSEENTAPYPGIKEMLQRLHCQGARIAVVSNKFDAAAKALVNHYFGNLVKVTVGEREGVRKKPAPDTVESALHLLQCSKEGAVYIGDSDVDILTAKAVGIPCISVLWGFRDKEFLLQHGATTLISSPEEII